MVRELYVNKEWLFTVFQDRRTQEHFIEILCGTVGMYPVRVKLNRKEVALFKKDPTRLVPLAMKILRSPEGFPKTR
jgi:hypothetical protein